MNIWSNLTRFSQSYALTSPIRRGPMLAHTLPVLYKFFLKKGKKPTQSIAFEVTLPEEFCTEVIYCLAQLKFKKKKSEPVILVSFQDIPFETTQAKIIFTKVRHSQTTLRGGEITRKIYERD